MSASAPILLIAEVTELGPTRLTRELLALALRLKASSAGSVSAALFGRPSGAAAEALIALGAERVYCLDHPALDRYHSEAWVSAAAQLCGEIAPELVLAGHTATGADLAPRLAFRLEGAVATGCVEIARQDGAFHFTRPCHGGNLRETLSFATARCVATVRAGCGEASGRNDTRRGEIRRFIPRLGAELQRVRVVERRAEDAGGIRLEDAPVIVAGGRGLNGPAGFRTLEQLADALGGAVGASRVPCDLGWCPRSWQIGLTGRTVQPDLYIAVGISGAGHHMAGCGNAKTIVAVNTDPEAAIYRDARFGIVGDYQQFIPAFIEEVRTLKRAASETR
ncbi:MAG: electron transfer flavoprotein subunit alpha/FixB family protein [Betaproteobacteria bacterium]